MVAYHEETEIRRISQLEARKKAVFEAGCVVVWLLNQAPDRGKRRTGGAYGMNHRRRAAF